MRNELLSMPVLILLVLVGLTVFFATAAFVQLAVGLGKSDTLQNAYGLLFLCSWSIFGVVVVGVTLAMKAIV
jgi:hypothetical protein